MQCDGGLVPEFALQSTHVDASMGGDKMTGHPLDVHLVFKGGASLSLLT